MKAKVYIGAIKYAVYIGRKIVEKTMNFFGFPARFFATKDGNLKDYKMYGKTLQSNLPEGYTQLEYLEGTGTQYIVTDFFFDNVATDTLSCDFMRTTTGAGSLLYGCRDAYKVNGYGFQFNDTGRTYRQYGDSDTGLGSTYVFNLDTRYTAKQTGYTYVIGGRTSAVVVETAPIQNYPLTVFATRNADQPTTAITPMRLYNLNVVNASGKMILNLVPARRNDGVLGMYDTVKGKFYTNAGTGEFIAGNTIGLPDEYTQLEYIVADGNAYVDTGFKANTTTTRFVGAFRLTSVSVSQGFFGSRNGNTADDGSCMIAYVSSGGYVRGDWVSGSPELRVPASINTIITTDVTRGYGVISGTTVTSTKSTSIDQINNFYVGRFRNGDGTMFTSGVIGHIFPCQLISNGIVIRNFVPAKRNSDEKIGMYDIENNVFYPSAGESEFAAGPVFSIKPTPTNPIAIESVGERTKNLFNYEDFFANYQTYSTSAVGRFPIKLKPNTKYTVSTNTSRESATASCVFVVSGNAINWSPSSVDNGVLPTASRTVTTDSEGWLCIGMHYNRPEYKCSIDFFRDGTSWTQVEEGSVATAYEPYGYKIPVNVANKNILNPNAEVYNGYIGLMNVGEVIRYGSSTASKTYKKFAYFKPGTYTYSYNGSASTGSLRFVLCDENEIVREIVSTPVVQGRNEVTVNFTKEGWGYVSALVVATDIQIEEGDTATKYEPYFNQTTNIYLSEPLRKLGDYTDYIDFENQKVVRQVGGITFNGRETWTYYNVSGVGKLFRTVVGSAFASGTKYDLGAICDKYTTVEQSARTNNTMTGIDRNIDLVNNNFSDVTSWKAELTRSNVTVVYPLATPTEESITLPAIVLQQGNLSMDVETKIKPSQLTITGDIDDVR